MESWQRRDELWLEARSADFKAMCAADFGRLEAVLSSDRSRWNKFVLGRLKNDWPAELRLDSC